MCPTPQIDAEKRIAWTGQLLALCIAVAATALGGYLPVAALLLCGADPWGWPWGMVTPLACPFGASVGVGVGLLFGYGIAERLAGRMPRRVGPSSS